MNDFGIRLKELRLEKNILQKDVGKAVGSPQTRISQWEQGKLEPNFVQLKSLAMLFEVSVDYLLGFSDDFGNIKIKAPDLDDEEQELIDLYRDSTPGEREAVLTLMRRRKNIKRGYNIG